MTYAKENFIKKNCKRQNQTEFRNEKAIKAKGDNLNFEWKGYDN